MDTIYALATARGRSGLAVVRVSGPLALVAGAALCGPLPAPRVAGLRRLTWDGELLDEALVLTFAKGASFTGEAVVELQCHGGPAVVGAVLRALSAQPGLRLAEPGEFTRRALENGVLDLAQAEGLADLIDAETEAQRRQAVRVLSGSVGRRVDAWRRDLIRAGALLEATIDFADEEVPVDVSPEVLALIDGLMADLAREAAGVKAAERIRDGFEVAIVGAPNVGKSTLLNRLARADKAIVSAVPGTTRDVIEVDTLICDVPVRLYDTAGLRDTHDPIEQEGIRRANEVMNSADLIILMTDQAELLAAPDLFARLGQAQPADARVLVVHNKIDAHGLQPQRTRADDAEHLFVSAREGHGLDLLTETLGDLLGIEATSENEFLARARHIAALELALGELAPLDLDLARNAPELTAEGLRRAADALHSIIGGGGSEALLGEIFSRFCIGK